MSLILSLSLGGPRRRRSFTGLAVKSGAVDSIESAMMSGTDGAVGSEASWGSRKRPGARGSSCAGIGAYATVDIGRQRLSVGDDREPVVFAESDSRVQRARPPGTIRRTTGFLRRRRESSRFDSPPR